MTWKQSRSGLAIDLVQPDLSKIDLRVDVAIPLSLINRFDGHASVSAWHGYSVAQHCCLGASAILHETGGDTDAALHFLLHDAHEVFSGDITTLKQQLQAATEEIKALEAQQATMGGTLQKVANMPAPVTAAEQRRMAVVLALGSLRGALAADKPYAAGLKAVDLLAGDDAELKSKLAPALDPLRSLAETGE